MPFEHRPWSTFGDADKILPYNPLRRVPTLVLDDGEALIESGAILDYLDEEAGGTIRRLGQIGMTRDHLEAFATKLTHDDHVVVEATGNATAVAEAIGPHVSRVRSPTRARYG